jgi:hypothetical protein
VAESDSKYDRFARKAAKAKNLKYYFTGKPCKHGHLSKRLTRNGLCHACSREFARQYARRDRYDPVKRPKVLERSRKRRAKIMADPIKKERYNLVRNEWQRQFNAKPQNKEWRREYGKNRYRADPLRDIARVQKRRMEKISDGGSFTEVDIENIYRMQHGRCAYCRIELNGKYQIDHIQPRGGNWPSNLQLTCKTPKKGHLRCNQMKADRDPIDFARKEFGLLL